MSVGHRVGIIQSAYIPWRGYFDFIASVDVFVLFDDVQYPLGRSWRNRNRVNTKDGPRWLKVPVRERTSRRAIDETMVDEDIDWRAQHRLGLEDALRPCPHRRRAMDLWERGVDTRGGSISRLNRTLLTVLCDELGVRTPIIDARTLNATGTKSDRLLQIIEKLGGRTYLSGPAARSYLDTALFAARGVRVEYKRYAYPPYPQLWPSFDGAVTVLDLIANLGDEARAALRSSEPDEVVVP